jgi:hypothetical protein
MKKPIGIVTIALGLMLNATYLIYSAFNAFSVSASAWAGVSLIAAYGIFNVKHWSQYFAAMLAVFSIAGWADGTIQTYGKSWPLPGISATIISFVPAVFFLCWWIFAVAYVINYFRKGKET